MPKNSPAGPAIDKHLGKLSAPLFNVLQSRITGVDTSGVTVNYGYPRVSCFVSLQMGGQFYSSGYESYPLTEYY